MSLSQLIQCTEFLLFGMNEIVLMCSISSVNSSVRALLWKIIGLRIRMNKKHCTNDTNKKINTVLQS